MAISLSPRFPDQQFCRSSLFQPSLGHWNTFIREASAIAKAEGMIWTFPELVAAYEGM
jgi:hypothetical protein